MTPPAANQQSTTPNSKGNSSLIPGSATGENQAMGTDLQNSEKLNVEPKTTTKITELNGKEQQGDLAGDKPNSELQKNEDTTRNWANLFSSNRLASRGMNLKYVAPMIQDGENIAQLRKEDVDKETEK